MKMWSILLFLLLTFAVHRASASEQNFVGVESCFDCHDEMEDSFNQTLHGRAFSKESRHYENRCETCHGPGEDHEANPSSDNIISFGENALSNVSERNRQCLNCHGSQMEIALWKNSLHARHDLSCDSCHPAHKGYSPINKSPEGCYACHLDIRIDSRMQSRHPINEGKVSCADCHNPHGTMSDAMLTADTLNDLCYSCHADKRGPYMWEHSPVEENCGICHTPHGSRHKKLLLQRAPTLCQNCHMGGHTSSRAWDKTAGFDGTSPSNRYYGRSCMNCHPNVHGSMHPSSQGKRLIK